MRPNNGITVVCIPYLTTNRHVRNLGLESVNKLRVFSIEELGKYHVSIIPRCESLPNRFNWP